MAGEAAFFSLPTNLPKALAGANAYHNSNKYLYSDTICGVIQTTKAQRCLSPQVLSALIPDGLNRARNISMEDVLWLQALQNDDSDSLALLDAISNLCLRFHDQTGCRSFQGSFC